MNTKELKIVKKLLDDYTERFSTLMIEGKRVTFALTAYWNGGGQKLFYTVEQVIDWIEDKKCWTQIK